MKWKADYVSDENGNQIFKTEIKQVPSEGVVGDALSYVADAATAIPASGGAVGLMAKGVGKNQAVQATESIVKTILPKNARIIKNPETIFKRLEKFHGVDPNVASKRLHDIKYATGRGGADNVIFDRTGGVYDPETRELLGNLIK